MINRLNAPIAILVILVQAGAMQASVARAETWFHSDTNPTVLTSEETETTKFTINGGTAKCTTKYDGTVMGVQNGSTYTAKTITLTPTISNCIVFGFVGATIDVDTSGHECGYLLHLTENTPATATMDVTCKAPGEDITITAISCTVHIPQQVGLKHFVFEAQGASTDMKSLVANIKVEGIRYNETSGCLAPGESANGTFTGKLAVKGFVDAGGSGYQEGAQRGIWIE